MTMAYRETWRPLDAVDMQGMFVMEAAVERCGPDVDVVFPFARVGANVRAAEGCGQPCAGWFTVMVFVVSAESAEKEGIPHGRVKSFEAAFGAAEGVDYVHPRTRSSRDAACVLERSFAVGAESPVRESLSPWSGEGYRHVEGIHKWVVCVVYKLEGCGSATLHVSAGAILGKAAEAAVEGLNTRGAEEGRLCRWAKCVERMVKRRSCVTRPWANAGRRNVVVG
jgi:hypothetical protein